MIILGGTIIISLTNNNIKDRANEAVTKTELNEVKNLAGILWAEAYLDKVEDKESYVIEGLKKQGIDTHKYEFDFGETGVEVSPKGEINEDEEDNGPEGEPPGTGGDNTGDSSTDKVEIPESWQASVSNIVDEVPIPKGFVASPYDGENEKDGGLVIYQLTADEIKDKVTVLPTETQYKSWTERNQYVWVPVDRDKFTTQFVREVYDGKTIADYNNLGSYSNVSSEFFLWEIEVDSDNMPLTKENLSDYIDDGDLDYISEETLSEVQEMYASVKKYGGFYIARYEAGVTTQRTSTGTSLQKGEQVYSVMGKKPYTHIKWGESLLNNTGGAVEVARSVYSKSNNNYGVVSTLIYGVQWDRTLQWFIDTGELTLEQVKSEKPSFGNYYGLSIEEGDLNQGAQYATTKYGELNSYADVQYNEEGKSISTKSSDTSWGLTTGALKRAKLNNIYDMAGNIEERTMEIKNRASSVLRGNGYQSYTSIPLSSALVSISSRYSMQVSYADGSSGGDYGFRVSLYIK